MRSVSAARAWRWPRPVAMVAVVVVGVAIGYGSALVTGAAVGALALITVGMGALLPFAGRLDRLGPAIAGAVVVGSTLAKLWSLSLPGELITGIVRGAAYAVLLIIPALMINAQRRHRRYQRQGWSLALAEAQQHDRAVERAVERERRAMASEIHDGLGHRLTLIAVQAGRLSLDRTLPEPVRGGLEEIRRSAADACDELGQTVTLLRDPDLAEQSANGGRGLAALIERAVEAGLDVHAEVSDDLQNANEHTRAGIRRAAQEALTNAARHAAGAPVELTVTVDRDWVELRSSNPRAATPGRPASGGTGLVGLRHRASLLGGTVSVAETDLFVLTVGLPLNAVPGAEVGARSTAVAAQESEALRRRAGARKLVWLVPLAIVAGCLALAAGFFVYATVASVLTPQTFATIAVGDAQETTLRRLPPTEMLDAPRTDRPDPAGAKCQYYEASISFFERDDVYRVCFAEGHVVAADVIPAP